MIYVQLYIASREVTVRQTYGIGSGNATGHPQDGTIGGRARELYNIIDDITKYARHVIIRKQ